MIKAFHNAVMDTQMTTIDKKLEAAMQRVKQLKELKKKQEAKQRTLETKRKRAEDTRRKVLVGAFVIDLMEKNGIGFASLSYESVKFSDWLTRDDDLALFGLQPKQAK